MKSAKEAASNVAASAKAGMEKTKATMQEKGEKMTTRDPLQKEMATEKKEERIHAAEREKLETRQQAAAAKQGGVLHPTGQGYTTQPDPTAVPPQDPNVAGGARTGYGSGNTY
ncbi:hypothetical protein ACJIZ3_005810 [Penstemon smallii]|uniref:Uncharacterized protein n=1 Tax=Penstemon smallii TaxID=265156 RepID=A0ABD3S5X9_9LAMI